MKNIFILILLSQFIISCNKEKKVVYPAQVQTSTYSSVVSTIGKEYVLDSAVIYFENQSNGAKIYYNHFDTIQKKSVLDPFYGAVIPFDSLLQGMTKWKFLPNYKFQLNDSLVYNFEQINNVFRVYGLENGSARPIEFLHALENTLVVKVFESYTTINNVDYRFYNVLHFKEKGNPIKSQVYASEFGASFNGTLPLPTTIQSNDLTGTRWVIYKYVKNLSTITCSDTLNFKTKTYYTYNNNAVRNYNLQYISGTGMFSLNLYDCYTLGGSYSGQLLSTFIKDGQINALTMKNLYNSDKVIVWLKKI